MSRLRVDRYSVIINVLFIYLIISLFMSIEYQNGKSCYGETLGFQGLRHNIYLL